MDSTTLPPPQFKDRKVGLVIFGIATLCAGCLCALFVPLLVLGMAAAAHSPKPPPPVNIVPIALLYGALAIVLIWLGIGSIMTRRWARALLAIWSWSWLFVGVLGIVAFIVMVLPQITKSIQAAQRPGQSSLTLLALVPMIMMGFMFIVLPLIWGLFYSGKNVRATCEARDPVMRWTDRCPIPVLAASLWLVFGGVSTLVMPFVYPVAPFFGLLLSGAPAIVFYLLLAAVWLFSGWSLYRLEPRGWWIIVVALVIFAISSFITYSRHDITEVYSLMGYPAEQVRQMQMLGFSGKGTMQWTVVFCTLPFLGYLIYIRKFLNNSGLALKDVAL